MGTLGCINDMQRRDKENREIRKLGRERLKEIRNRLLETGIDAKRIHTSVERMEEIRRKTQEKEEADNKYLFKVQLIVVVCVLLVLFLIWLVF